MEKLVEDKKLRKKLGVGGRSYVLKNFSSQTISKKWLEFYQEKMHV